MQALIRLTQFLERGFEKGLVLDFLSRAAAVARRVRPTSIPIAAGLFSAMGSGTSSLVGHKPPIRRLRNPRPHDLAVEAQFLRHIHPPEFGDPDAMIPQLELIVGQIKAGLTALFAFEFRPAMSLARLEALKKCLEGFAQVHKRLIRGVLGHVPRPGKVFPPDLVEALRCRLRAVGFSPAS
jgi:hypothetical protein